MAGQRTAPAGEPPDKYYKCHSKTRFSTIVCLFCEDPYHPSCFDKLKNKKRIGEILAICPKHAHLKLTSNFNVDTLSDDVKLIIADIKATRKEVIQKEILDEIAVANSTNVEDSHNETIFDNNTELENLKIETTLLRELNKELQEKNYLLRELLNAEKEKVNSEVRINKKTYAEATINSKPLKKRIPKIIIHMKNEDDDINKIKKKVTHYLTKEKTIKTKSLQVKNNKEININCLNEDSTNKAAKILSSKLSDKCKIGTESISKPKIKVVGIDNFENMNDEELESDINTRNFKDCDGKCVVLSTYKNTRNNTITAIIEVPSEIYKIIRECYNNKIYVGYQNCKIYDLINIKPCYKCGSFGHNSYKCSNDLTCLKCAGSHISAQCQIKDNFTCVNCFYSNAKYKTNFEVNHMANDSEKCKILKGKINRDIDMTDYPVRPYVPRLIGKVENIKITTNQTQPHAVTAMPMSQSVLSIASLGLQSSKESLNDNGSSPARR